MHQKNSRHMKSHRHYFMRTYNVRGKSETGKVSYFISVLFEAKKRLNTIPVFSLGKWLLGEPCAKSWHLYKLY
ncbi:hypothetical protein BSK71_08935 [Pectobacterium actinidiae]|uniref:Uncharacterized protein n=1 Tax=Pectobacterium actinidiae TaxID=1507808 RepID=A0A1V2R5R4_9GAMM|nr:hypothetical protein BSK69_08650 [Pectobacterium actinidiae]ONK07783.1 hypothetical protein BSK71_08935 [Pectobacterium actinidiae]